MPDPEQLARQEIDALLGPCGWMVKDKRAVNLAASRGVAVRELSFKGGEPDYTLFVDGKAIGTIEAKPAGHSLTGVEEQLEKYVRGVPFGLPAWRSPLPFSYESTGTETRFANRLDPVPRSRNVFVFHRPETLLHWVEDYAAPQAVDTIAEYAGRKGNFLSRIQHMPPLIDDIWPPKPQAIMNIEQSLRDNRPRSLVQMATGSGKTLLAIESRVLPAYLEIALNCPTVVDAIDRQKAGINESGVSLTHDKLRVVLIPVPSLPEQKSIVAEVERRLSVVEGLQAVVNATLQRTTRLRQSILQRAFEGTLLIKTKFDAANPPSQGFLLAAEPKASYGPSRR